MIEPAQLLPCPFCGGEPNLQTERVYHPPARVFCDQGAHHAVFICGDTKEEAIAAWNRRATSAAPGELPPLPEAYPIQMTPDPEGTPFMAYDADQMQAYARTALAQQAGELVALREQVRVMREALESAKGILDRVRLELLLADQSPAWGLIQAQKKVDAALAMGETK